MSDMLTIWHEANENGRKRGLDAIRTIATEKPDKFVAAMLGLIPREISLDDETTEGFAAVWNALAKASASRDD